MRKIVKLMFVASVLMLSSCEKFIMNNDGFVNTETEEEHNLDDCVALQEDGIMVQKYDISSGADWGEANNLCKKSRVGGYKDWRLPTIGELQVLYNKRDAIGGFDVNAYWSSTRNGYESYYYLNFKDGTQNSRDDSYTARVRAVRTLP